MTDLESRVRQLEAQIKALQQQVGPPPSPVAKRPPHRAQSGLAVDAASAWERFLHLTEVDLDIVRAGRGILAKVTPLGMVADTMVLSVPDSKVKGVIETRLHDVFVRHLGAALGRPVRIAVTIATARPAGEVIPFDLHNASPFSRGGPEVLSAAQGNAGELLGFLIDEPDDDDDDGLGGVLAKIS